MGKTTRIHSLWSQEFFEQAFLPSCFLVSNIYQRQVFSPEEIEYIAAACRYRWCKRHVLDSEINLTEFKLLGRRITTNTTAWSLKTS